MSVEQSNSEQVVQTESTSGGTDGEKVSYDSFRKSVAAEKSARARAQSLEEQLNAYKTKELESQGKTEEVLASYKSRIGELEGTLKNERKQYAWERISSGIQTEALKQGCKHPDLFLKSLEDAELESLQVEDGYKVNNESLARVVEAKRKRYPDLFAVRNVNINDSTPVSRLETKTQVNLKDMSKEEMEKLLLTKFSNKG